MPAGSSAAGATSRWPGSAAEAQAGLKPSGAQRSARWRASSASLSDAAGGFAVRAIGTPAGALRADSGGRGRARA